MWLMTTRNRPDACQAMIDAMTATGDVPEFAVMVDQDEMAGYAAVRWPAHWHIHLAGDHLEMGAALNRLVDMYPDRPFYGFVADHGRPMTKGWSGEMELSAGDWNIAYSDDGFLHGRRQDRPWLPRTCGATVLGGRLVKTLGWAMLPGLVHLYVDDAIETVGDRLGLMRYRPDVLVQTDRPETTGKPKDANHARRLKGVPFAASDQATFEAWRDGGGLAADVERVSQASGLQPVETIITFACVKVGPNYGPEWVNLLLDMVRRHLPDGYKFNFACVTDDPTGLADGIDIKFSESGIEGWWAKLQLFSPRMFERGQRIIYLDLDSLVLDGLDRALSYRGPLALLRDFYRPDGLGSGVMLWGVGEGTTDIWTEWEAAGRPRVEGGDQAWIERIRPNAIRLQDMFPGDFVSYKVDCMSGQPPRGAVVCSFHGEPKCDTAAAPWVHEVWRLGGGTMARDLIGTNTSDEIVRENIRANGARDLPWFRKYPAHEKMAVIVGGGASTAKYLDQIRTMAAEGAKVFALNGAGAYLRANGIQPTYLIVLDPRPDNARFVSGNPAAITLIASQCAPSIVDAALAEDCAVLLYHLALPGCAELLPRPADLCWCSTTVGLTALGLVHMMGYRTQHLFGYDSSFHEGRLHAYEQTLTEQEGRRIEVWGAGKKFVTSAAMLKQTEEFQHAANMLADAGASIAVHGDGLLPHVAHELARLREAPSLEKVA